MPPEKINKEQAFRYELSTMNQQFCLEHGRLGQKLRDIFEQMEKDIKAGKKITFVRPVVIKKGRTYWIEEETLSP